MTEHEDILDFAASMRTQEIHMVLDNKTGLKGIIAIHSTKLGPSLGGCRLLPYTSTLEAAKDAIKLAQGMSYKSALADLPLGGGKAVLIKPEHKINRKAYFEALGEFLDLLNGRYITAVDSGTSVADMDVISTRTRHVTSTSYGEFSLADPSPMTALGVYQGILAGIKFRFNADSVNNIHVGVQGVGHVGSPLVEKLVKNGAIVTIFDTNNKAVTACLDKFSLKTANSVEEILSLDCDVFAPCALGGVLNHDTIPRVKAPIIAGGANNQLLDPRQDAALLTKHGILYAPDFVINAGGIIYVCGQHLKDTEAETRKRISNLYHTLLNIFTKAKADNLPTYDVAYSMAWEKLYED